MPDWMNEEKERAGLLNEDKTVNENAPKLIKVKREPKRSQKAFYLQKSYSLAFEKLVFEQKQIKGKKAPALIEEAIELLLKKYGRKV